MSRRLQSGLTLVELLIAMTLGLLLIGGALKVLQSTQQSYRLQENMSRLQENGRFAIEMLARDLRMAGFSHCGAMESIDIHNNVKSEDGGADPAFDFDDGNSIYAYQPEGALPDSDAFRLRHADERSLEIVEEDTKNDNANLKVAGNALGLEQDDVVTVTTCTEGDTFRITNEPQQTDDTDQVVTLAHAANNNTSPKLQGEYSIGDQLLLVRELGWFVGNTGRSYDDGAPIPALYRESHEGVQGMVDDVRAMRLRYGVDANGNGSVDSYEAASDVGSWSDVVAIRASLLLQTADNHLADSPSSVIFGNAEVTAEDRRILRVFTTTVALRNRIGGGGLQ